MIDKRKEFIMGYHEFCLYHPGIKTKECKGVYKEAGNEKTCSFKVLDQDKCSLAQEGTK